MPEQTIQSIRCARLFSACAGLALLLLGGPAQSSLDGGAVQAHTELPVHYQYRPWPGFMRNFAQGENSGNGVDYERVYHRGLGFLEKYIARLERIAVSGLNRDQQLAFWLNLHNAQAVRVAGAAYPLSNSKSLVIGKQAQWAEKTMTVEGRKLSLRDIANLVANEWRDPRIVYGLFLPAKSAPQLPQEGFRGDQVWQQLEALGRLYVNRAGTLRINENKLAVPQIYHWHKDLWPDPSWIIRHIQDLAGPKLSERLKNVDKISDYYFDWRINNYDTGFDPATKKTSAPKI